MQLDNWCVYYNYYYKGLNTNQVSIYFPTLLSFFQKKSEIKQIASSCSHTVILLKNGSLWASGRANRCGQSHYSRDGYYKSFVAIQYYYPIDWICSASYINMYQLNDGTYQFFGEMNSGTINQILKSQPLQLFDSFPFPIKKSIYTSQDVLYILTRNNDLYSHEDVFTTVLHKSFSPQKIGKWKLKMDHVYDIQDNGDYLILIVCDSFFVYPISTSFVDIRFLFH